MTNKQLDNIWKDLGVWQAEINAKDEALTRRKPVHNQALPPVRQPAELILDNLKPVGLDSLTTKKSATKTITQTRTEKAEAEKAKGNEYFGKKDFEKAIAYYGKAIDLDPTVSVYFVNRAMAYLKINRFLEAEKDCTRGIQLQPKNVKALWRRGIALRELGRINEARRDFETGLSIEPNNKSLLDELKKLPTSKSTEKPKANIKPLVEQKRRLPIHVVDEAYSESKSITEPTISNPIKVQEIEKKSVVTPPPLIQKEPTPKATVAAPVATPKPTPVAITPKPTPVATTPKPAPVIKFNCPRTNFEFERDWKTYKGRGDDVLYQYFQCIPPSSYTTLFKSSLESDQFEKMIDILESKYVKEKTSQQVFNVLESLSQVKRIDMLIMFLNKKHQQAIQTLFNAIKDSDISKDMLTKVAKVYGASI
ncbi:hypothetical protein BDF21DRAFT_459475 [Thamnidium elegans]|uniref:RNA polymerase II-associated protein 3 n=1 Tax=Thamnidium elegans TaxID=101142 RepID=A0A8H7SXD5_9FUNG|nr:hypothetical protein INT48_003765 [Thamnidium elegans]KAI8091801.1 hypothetical protein BDF21DRAFT_459475 [Thamnidium elegans]